jgi:hypothetical protein
MKRPTFVATRHIEGIQIATFCVKSFYIYFSTDYFVLRPCLDALKQTSCHKELGSLLFNYMVSVKDKWYWSRCCFAFLQFPSTLVLSPSVSTPTKFCDCQCRF